MFKIVIHGRLHIKTQNTNSFLQHSPNTEILRSMWGFFSHFDSLNKLLNFPLKTLHNLKFDGARSTNKQQTHNA